MAKYINPLDLVKDREESQSNSSASGKMESLSGMNVDSENVCPKCNTATLPSKLSSGESVRFCTTCHVTMAIKS
jgi:hypothetical protein